MRLLLAAALIASAASAQAGGDAPSIAGQYLDLSPVALPVTENGRLRNYVFVSLRLNLRAGIDPSSVRVKEPFFRDALVRAGHHSPFSFAGDMTRVDETRIRAVVLRQAAAIIGPGAVTSVGFASPPAPRRRTGLTPSHR